MRMNETIKPKPALPAVLNRGVLMGIGITLIVLSVVTLTLSVWEGFFNNGRIQVVQIPGFNELKLDTPGLYAGLYQHQGASPLPTKMLSQLDVRILSKGEYEEVPVLMNTQGQTFERLGMRGMPVFNFVIERPGVYTMSAVSTGSETEKPLSIFIIPQTASNIKQTLVVGIAFFALFLAAGIFVLIRMKRWTPKT